MIGVDGHFIIYDDLTFNCPDCCAVHFEKDWRPHWVKDGEKIVMKCVRCRHMLILIVNENFTKITTLRLEKLVNKLNKQK